MLKIRQFIYAILTGVFSLSLLFSTGCSRHPNPEQISKMEEARKACLAAEQKLNEIVKTREGLEKELAAKQKELKDLQKEKEMIQQRLRNWQSE